MGDPLMDIRNKRAAVALGISLLVVVGWFCGRALDTDKPADSSRAPEQNDAPPTAVERHAAERPSLDSLEPEPERATPDESSGRDEPNPLANGPNERFHPRDPSEWQGMLVDMSQPQICERSMECGLALACGEDGHCGPCRSDDDCGVGEGCALDHCLPRKNLACRTRGDCGALGPEAVCMLSGITGGEPRGNTDMRAFCNSGVGGEDPRKQAELNDERAKTRAAGRPETPPLTEARILRELRNGNHPPK